VDHNQAGGISARQRLFHLLEILRLLFFCDPTRESRAVADG
jgi:hypothetical protein